MFKAFRALLALALLLPAAVLAQSETDTTTTEEAAAETEGLLTQAELENLVAPVALFPDTLLIQILVAATQPMEVVKSDRLLRANEGEDPEVIKAAVEAEEYDESVEVLAVAFPEVIEDMALHLEWTETIGAAMLAQSDDVLTAVQTMRQQAVNTGALVSGEEQTVEVTEEEIIIQPADPEVVYVPQYDPEVVYVEKDDNVVGDAIAAGVIAFITFTVIDEIFDDDDDWNDYWGCRNCGGWNGRPIIRNPDIDLDIDGNVNIGNRIGNRVGNGDRDIDIGDRRPEDGWRPREDRAKEARDKIADKRKPDGGTKLPINKGDSRSDALREQLSNRTGAPDISRPGTPIDRDAIRNTKPKGNLGNIDRGNAGDRAGNLPRPSKSAPAGNRTPGAKKPSVKKPAAKAPGQRISKPKSVNKPKAIGKKSNAGKARKASNRGKASGRKIKGRR